MTHINIKKLEKSFGDSQVLQNITFSVEQGEKNAIVGANGCGKSTLLNIIAGIDIPDSGTLSIAKGTSLGFMNQDALQSFNLKNDFVSIDPKYFSLLNMGANFDAQTILSGGEITKVALSKLLSQNPNLLLLDEPTNNLDFDGINTLIQLLFTYDGTLIIVSHDRYFLDALISKLYEIDLGVAKEYIGNYSDYRETKARLFDESLNRYQEGRKQQKQITESVKQLKNWSEKAHRDSTKMESASPKMGLKEKKRAKAKKMDKRIKSNINRIEKLKTEGEQRPLEEKTVYFEIKSSGSHGRRILQATDLCKYYGDKLIFDKSNFTISRGEKVAVFGANGCGKTTLVKILVGIEAPTNGELWCSPSSAPFILHQDFELLPQNKTVQEYFIGLLGNLTANQRNILFNLGLTSKHLNQKIGTLSFGEQMKLKLSEPILKECDFLILDEPTNHIDAHTRQMLEKTLQAYNGTLIIISHDIKLLAGVCSKVLLFEDKKIIKLHDSFSEYFEKTHS